MSPILGARRNPSRLSQFRQMPWFTALNVGRGICHVAENYGHRGEGQFHVTKRDVDLAAKVQEKWLYPDAVVGLTK